MNPRWGQEWIFPHFSVQWRGTAWMRCHQFPRGSFRFAGQEGWAVGTQPQLCALLVPAARSRLCTLMSAPTQRPRIYILVSVAQEVSPGTLSWQGKALGAWQHQDPTQWDVVPALNHGGMWVQTPWGASAAVCGLIPEMPMQDMCLCPKHSQYLTQDTHPGSARREAESPATPDKTKINRCKGDGN